MEKRIDFAGRLDSRTVQGDGSVRFKARLTRTGVFDYGDHKELRVPDEVFAKKSLDSFKGVTVTDGHRAFVDSTNWKSYAVGHVGDDVHQDGEYVVASIVISDAATLKKIDGGELAELSMGYTVNLDKTPGVTENGEKYDAIQRDIFGNHAALGPSGWGRAGSTVRLLDGAAYACDMSEQRIDAPSDLQKELDAAKAEIETLRKERDTAKSDAAEAAKKADQLEAARDAEKARAEKAEAVAAQAKNDEAARVDARVALIDSARAVLGKDEKLTDKSDRDIRLAVIAKVDPNLKLDGKSDDYVSARFDAAVASVNTDRAALAEVNAAVAAPVPSTEKSRLDEALENQATTRAAQASAGPPPGALVRK